MWVPPASSATGTGVCVGSASLPPARSSTYQRCANRGRTGCLRSHPHTGSRRGRYAEHGASRRQCVGRGFEPVLGVRDARVTSGVPLLAGAYVCHHWRPLIKDP